MDRITGLRVFSRVASLGSLSAAARSLGMSQTMATKHLAALEERLGIKLVHRSTRRLTLTEAGRSYLEAAERILVDLEDADAQASAQSVEVRGTLRLNAPLSFGIREIAPRLLNLKERHPGLRIDLGLNDRFVDPIEEGWDLVIRVGALADSQMIARRIAPCRTVVCAAPAYLQHRGSPRRIADLKEHDCLGYTLSRSLGAERWSFGEKGRKTVPVQGSLRANNGDCLLAAARAGQGIVYLPTFLVSADVAEGTLVTLEFDEPTIDLDGVFAIYPHDRRPPAKVRAVLDFFAERFRPEPPWDAPFSANNRAARKRKKPSAN